MSEYCFDSQSAESVSEFAPEGLTPAMCPPAPSVPMPFELDSSEADALRGAISFLFSLITFYDELTTLDALERESGACEDGGLQ